ncbi:transposase domain-containing protein [Thiospirochaeta perfilievii]|uniref:Transposase domain-containing protein n=1 Tax=Thiospirochaeta perfilievii TaxID=252967 RepID=A0A5C1QE33_9SPIO|nr:transposase domain-containing protein [Thiospirochaeta perfilievii]
MTDKLFIFADSLCFFYSIIETAKLNGLNPYAYLKWLFENVVLLSEGESMEHLTPWNCDSVEVNKIML